MVAEIVGGLGVTSSWGSSPSTARAAQTSEHASPLQPSETTATPLTAMTHTEPTNGPSEAETRYKAYREELSRTSSRKAAAALTAKVSAEMPPSTPFGFVPMVEAVSWDELIGWWLARPVLGPAAGTAASFYAASSVGGRRGDSGARALDDAQAIEVLDSPVDPSDSSLYEILDAGGVVMRLRWAHESRMPPPKRLLQIRGETAYLFESDGGSGGRPTRLIWWDVPTPEGAAVRFEVQTNSKAVSESQVIAILDGLVETTAPRG